MQWGCGKSRDLESHGTGTAVPSQLLQVLCNNSLPSALVFSCIQRVAVRITLDYIYCVCVCVKYDTVVQPPMFANTGENSGCSSWQNVDCSFGFRYIHTKNETLCIQLLTEPQFPPIPDYPLIGLR